MTPTREAVFGPYEPLSEEDRAILHSWNYKPDDPKAEPTVRVHRLQRWLNSLLLLPFMTLTEDGKRGPDTANAVGTMMWSESEAAMLRSLGFPDSYISPKDGDNRSWSSLVKDQEPARGPVPKGVIRESTPLRYRRDNRDTYFDNFPESDPDPFRRRDWDDDI